MAKLEVRTKDNPKLGQSVLKDGRISLYLEYYMGRTEIPVLDEHGEQAYYTGGIMCGKPKYQVKHERKKESLNLYLWQAPRTPLERQQNKETLELAKEIRFEREQELKDGTLGYRLKAKEINFLDFLQAYYDNYTISDIRMIKLAIRRFNEFIGLEYPMFKHNLPPQSITPAMMEKFVEYLQSKSIGEGALTHWKRWKKIVKAAVKQNILTRNPCEDIVCRCDTNTIKKEILSQDEMELLINTTYPEQNQHTRRAFIFTLYTGIRFCDIKELTFANVDYQNRLLTFNQIKTEGHSSKSYVSIPLNDGLLKLIGKPTNNKYPQEKIFKLPSHTMCLKALRVWTAKAGISKHITWHCGRHSFAVNILTNGANIKTVSSLLGHSSIAMTEKYLHVVDKLKEDAINSLPELNI